MTFRSRFLTPEWVADFAIVNGLVVDVEGFVDVLIDSDNLVHYSPTLKIQEVEMRAHHFYGLVGRLLTTQPPALIFPMKPCASKWVKNPGAETFPLHFTFE